MDAAARRTSAASRLWRRYFVHSTGHGLGLEIHENPRLARGDTTKLAAGNVVTIEPGVYIEGVGESASKTTWRSRERGAEILTTRHQGIPRALNGGNEETQTKRRHSPAFRVDFGQLERCSISWPSTGSRNSNTRAMTSASG